MFFSNINSYYQTADLNVLFQSLGSFKTFPSFIKKLPRFYFSVALRSRGQTKQTLAATLLLQCSFLLVLGADNLVLQFYFFGRILSTWCWINAKVHRLQYTFSLYKNILWDHQTSKLYSGRVSCYMLIKYEEELWIFIISRGAPEYT